MDVVRALLSSKKAVTAIAAILFTIANSLGVTAGSEESLTMILGIAGTIIVGQGLADLGKEKAKIEAEVMASSDDERADALEGDDG